MREHIEKHLPLVIRRQLDIRRDRRSLNSLSRRHVSLDMLRRASDFSFSFLEDPAIEKEWGRAEERFLPFAIPDGTGGVNPGDRRALFYLLRYLKARRVLEVGTHIGASTVHIAEALSLLRSEGEEVHLDTVDFRDVNDPDTKPWFHFSSERPPRDYISDLACLDIVDFHACPATDFLPAGGDNYDLIFLDGSHAASSVYQEVPLALERLNPGGLILLHDYFPALKPLWKKSKVIPGPCLATDRLIDEGASFQALPFGELPWPTKLGGRTTSLAILVRLA
ncbi:MAG: class I SAM-dependent methyltransferase [Candidatus Krumholzibacteria bacterium]|jgi:predicted O-methyltransferase YrrM|nr:class I SAM-dependent methyltransferase [Candidatus Krumholzibacteria bacterium]MDP6797865.1 class I SAM-dependent methyltransferase [Candidatus Krumholzibacteria bacterium]MDP7021557.1 class I SAM-dependent methyltransferase [Candidatus Krumholzibacteria bacterium]